MVGKYPCQVAAAARDRVDAMPFGVIRISSKIALKLGIRSTQRARGKNDTYMV